MNDPTMLIKGQFYYSIGYQDSTLTKPIIASYEYVDEEMLENTDGKTEKHYLFKFHPVYKSDDNDALENGYIAYTTAQLEKLSTINSLIAELESARDKVKT